MHNTQRVRELRVDERNTRCTRCRYYAVRSCRSAMSPEPLFPSVLRASITVLTPHGLGAFLLLPDRGLTSLTLVVTDLSQEGSLLRSALDSLRDLVALENLQLKTVRRSQAPCLNLDEYKDLPKRLHHCSIEDTRPLIYRKFALAKFLHARPLLHTLLLNPRPISPLFPPPPSALPSIGCLEAVARHGTVLDTFEALMNLNAQAAPPRGMIEQSEHPLRILHLGGSEYSTSQDANLAYVRTFFPHVEISSSSTLIDTL